MAEIAATKATVKHITKMIQNGKTAQEISKETGVSIGVISVIEHGIALREGEDNQLERLAELAKKNASLSDNQVEVREYLAKQLAKLLIRAGLQPGQVHNATGLSIHKCRHIYTDVRKLFQIDEALVPPPTTVVSRMILSIFASHYTYLQEVSGTTSVDIYNVIIAWTRTIDEVIGNHIDQMEDFDSRLLSLGTFYEVARCLREVKPRSDEFDPLPYAKSRSTKLTRMLCPKCESYYIGFISARRATASQCCYCAVSNATNIATMSLTPSPSGRRRKKVQTEG